MAAQFVGRKQVIQFARVVSYNGSLNHSRALMGLKPGEDLRVSVDARALSPALLSSLT
jgi:hypothetical protein